jgi:hypothetical protein
MKTMRNSFFWLWNYGFGDANPDPVGPNTNPALVY